MRLQIVQYCLLLFFTPLSAMLVGNPSQPGILETGIYFGPGNFSFRAGYLDDWIYDQRFQDEFDPSDSGKTSTKLSTYAGLLTFNFNNRLDIYGLVGSSRLQIDEEIFTKRALAWGVGGKLVIFREGNFFIGLDAKYFQTSQKPRYFVIDGAPYDIVSHYRLKYHETQVAVGMAYRTSLFVPYLNGTYIVSKLEPIPNWTIIRLPDENAYAEVQTRSISSRNRFGVALGLTLVDSLKMSLSCEWRGFNQNAVDVNGEIRF